MLVPVPLGQRRDHSTVIKSLSFGIRPELELESIHFYLCDLGQVTHLLFGSQFSYLLNGNLKLASQSQRVSLVYVEHLAHYRHKAGLLTT